jgi:hypothetical protein
MGRKQAKKAIHVKTWAIPREEDSSDGGAKGQGDSAEGQTKSQGQWTKEPIPGSKTGP